MTGLWAGTLLIAWQTGLPLSEALEEWKREIEAKLAGRVQIVAVPGGELEEEDSDLLNGQMANPALVAAFERAQALTISVRVGARLRPFVLLNKKRIEATRNDASTLVAHELGHIWLQAQGLFPPRFGAGARACLAVHAGDIVQHEWIRAELDRRGIGWRENYARDYEAAWEAVKGVRPGGAGDDCRRAQRLSLMVDLRAAFGAEAGEWRNGYLHWLGEQDRQAEAVAIELVEGMGRREYAEALEVAEEAVFRVLGQ